MRSVRSVSSSLPSSDIASLRRQYHSLHEKDRRAVVDWLGSMEKPEAARELLELYRECQWRSTRLRILEALARHPNARSLEFLFRVARDESDIPMAEAAIRALGRSHHALPARFLVNHFRACAETLKPAVIAALGELPDRTLAAEFVKELDAAISGRKIPMIRSLTLALGELKVREALPLLERIVLEWEHRPVVLSALLAIGKVSRDPAFLDRVEERFRDDPFEHQLFLSARTQVGFRAQWALEDYLNRIFAADVFHRTLPFELMHFEARDVREGLRLFAADPAHFDRLCLALSRLGFPGVEKWYEELLPLDRLADEQACRVLESVSAHFDPDFAPLLKRFEGREGEVRRKWLDAVSHALPEADVVFSAWFDSPAVAGAEGSIRIEGLNSLENFALSAQCRPARQTQVTKLLERILEGDPVLEVRLRALRALARSRIASPRAFQFVRANLSNPVAAPSCLLFLEQCPVKDSLAILLAELPSAASDAERMWLRALRAQEKLSDQPKVDQFIAHCLHSERENEARTEALGLVADHRLGSHLEAVLRCLNGEAPVRLSAVVALRWIGDEKTADHLAGYLGDSGKVQPDESLAGRTLDALTALPGLRARRIVIDYLRDHAEDEEVCEKIARCLTPQPGASPDYFVSIIDQILPRRPDHPQLDALVALRGRFLEAAPLAKGGSTAQQGPDVAALDRELRKAVARYDELDESVRSALRAAETPFLHPEMFDENVDKSSSVLGYCKAIDLLLERELGRRHLFPKLENSLAEFQNVLHSASLNESYPDLALVMRTLKVEGQFTAQSFPLHKMAMIAHAILSGKILNDRMKTIDGLRAWAIVLLLFARRNDAGLKPLIPLRGGADGEVVRIARRLIHLQEIRNPAAHRETYPKFPTIQEVRREALETLNQIQNLF